MDKVNIELQPGESLGIVGESGSGKTVTCLSLLRMVPGAGSTVQGRVELDGESLLDLPSRRFASIRGRKIAMIMQNPMSSLDPLFTVGKQVTETMSSSEPRSARTARARRLLEMVRIPEPGRRLKAYPHQMSGGMRQRVVAAIALASEPRLILADEPTTALDVTVQMQFLDMLREVQRERGLGMVLISHDLGVAARACDRVAVMYAGRVVECAPIKTLFRAPHHPYSRALLSSIPRLGSPEKRLPTISGQPPDLANLPAGCAFAPRCPFAMPICSEQRPPTRAIEEGHTSECWLETDR